MVQLGNPYDKILFTLFLDKYRVEDFIAYIEAQELCHPLIIELIKFLLVDIQQCKTEEEDDVKKFGRVISFEFIHLKIIEIR